MIEGANGEGVYFLLILKIVYVYLYKIIIFFSYIDVFDVMLVDSFIKVRSKNFFVEKICWVLISGFVIWIIY